MQRNLILLAAISIVFLFGYFHYSLNDHRERLTYLEQKAASSENLSNTSKQPSHAIASDMETIEAINLRIDTLERIIASVAQTSSSLQQSPLTVVKKMTPDEYPRNIATTPTEPSTTTQQNDPWETLSQRFESTPFNIDNSESMSSAATMAINSLQSITPILIEEIACRSQACRIKWQYHGDQDNEETQTIEDEILAALSQTGLTNGSVRNDGAGGYEAILFQSPTDGETRDPEKQYK